MIRPHDIDRHSLTGRPGSTLAEVVVSLLVMSVGVVSLAVLFPISVLRSVQATQMTNATNLRYNVEALLAAQPQLVSIAPSWQPGINYTVGTFVTPTTLTSLKSPPVVFRCTTAGLSGTVEPAWNFTNYGSTTEYTANPPPPPPQPAIWTTYLLQNYVIDPLGESLVESTYRNTTNGDFFGNTGPGNPVTLISNGAVSIRAFSGFSGTPTVAQVDDLATLPDSWVSQLDSSQITTTTNTSCTIGDVRSAVSIPTSTDAFPPSRIVLFDDSGKVSYVRPIYTITTALPSMTFDWTPPAGVLSTGPLPYNFSPKKARIETKDRRYTWMLSVRRSFSGTSYLDVVVFFKRPFSGKDEQLYPATFTAVTDYGADGLPGVATIDDDGINGTDDIGETGWPGSDDTSRNWVIVQYDASASGNKPFVKKGGYVMDANNLRWYRIIDSFEGSGLNATSISSAMTQAGLSPTAMNPNGFTAPYQLDGPYYGSTKAILLRLETSIAQSGLQPATNGGTPTGSAMLMRGIVEVYPIRTQLSWGN